MNLKPQHLKCFWNKKNILFVSLVLVVALTVGVTAAWLTANDGGSDYVFEGANVVNSIDGEWITNVNGIKNVYVKNTGNVDGFVRAKPVVFWAQYTFCDGDTITSPDNDFTIHYRRPMEGTDYTIEYNSDNKWVQGADGYWYYRFPVSANGGKTSDLINKLNEIKEEPETGYHLKLTLVSDIIQVDPGKTWQKAWEKDEPQFRPAKLNATSPEAVTKTFNTSVMSFNIRWSGDQVASQNFGADNSTERDWDDRKEDIAYYLNKCNKDIICLQEVSQFQKTHLMETQTLTNADVTKQNPLYSAGYGYQYTGFEEYQEYNENSSYPRTAVMGSMVLYKTDEYECLNHDSFWLSDTPDVESDCFGLGYKRKCTITTLRHKATGKAVNVVNVHLPHETSEQGQKAREYSIDLIMKRMDRYIVDFTILAGDLNDYSSSTCYTNLADKMTNVLPDSDIKTMNSWSYDTTTSGPLAPEFAELKGPIDFIFYGSDIFVTSANVDNTAEQEYDPRGDKRLSNHYAVLADLTLSYTE